MGMLDMFKKATDTVSNMGEKAEKIVDDKESEDKKSKDKESKKQQKSDKKKVKSNKSAGKSQDAEGKLLHKAFSTVSKGVVAVGLYRFEREAMDEMINGGVDQDVVIDTSFESDAPDVSLYDDIDPVLEMSDTSLDDEYNI